ncbi:Na+/H+ antiporter subunit E [Agrococcus sp. Ld7]|uniref:Na+/H+ antiporter subunit E n=1 Tax=Agrococcus sp. Ld7 TaxID=649148 RepID=UPI0038703334
MRRPNLRARFSIVATVGLAIVWVMLWGEISLGAALWGILVALVIQASFPLPDVPELRFFRPVGFARLVVVTLWGLAISSFIVAVQVLAFWRPTKNAIIRVPLRSSSMFITAITAELITLEPGSVALDAGERWVLVHVFDASTPERIHRARESVRRTEATALWAFGTAADRALLEED